jgi:hypothetical protein
VPIAGFCLQRQRRPTPALLANKIASSSMPPVTHQNVVAPVIWTLAFSPLVRQEKEKRFLLEEQNTSLTGNPMLQGRSFFITIFLCRLREISLLLPLKNNHRYFFTSISIFTLSALIGLKYL